MMNNVMSSPITTSIGSTSILAAIVDLADHAVVEKTVSPNINADIFAIMAGVQGIFSKDFDRTGGSKKV